jgi:cytochrome oxidase assembly protein ShyY1
MTRRLPLIPTIVVAAAVALLVGLGVWQLKRAVWKEHLLARFVAAEKLPPVAFPTTPLHDDQLPLFRHATGVCLRPIGQRAAVGENQAGEPGYVQIIDCMTGAEGPGMSVEVGWSKNPNIRVAWPGGPVSGIIVPDKVSRMRLVAASAPPGLEPSQPPSAETASAITPSGHRMYAATWFALALVALIIYVIALRRRESLA